MRTKNGLTFCLPLVALASSYTSVGASASNPSTTTPTEWVVFLDISSSTESQWPDWANAGVAICHQVDYAQHISVYPLGSRTGDRKARFSKTAPSKGALRQLQALRALRLECEKAVRNVFKGPPEHETALLESVIHVISGRHVRAVYITDGLESSPLIDLEKFPLRTPEQARQLALQLAAKANLAQGKLAGARVDFILDNPATSSKRPLNSRALLQVFWTAVFQQHLGGEFHNFSANSPR